MPFEEINRNLVCRNLVHDDFSPETSFFVEQSRLWRDMLDLQN